jgi:transglutaminase-like putative cysteine protease
MTFHTYFLLSSYAFVATSFLALALTSRIDPLTMVLYASVLVGSWFVERRAPERRVSLRAARFIAVGYLPLLVFDALFLSSPILVLAHFVLFMSGVKLLQEKKDADWVWLYMLAFFEMLLAASLTIDMTFVISLFLFLFFFVTTLAAFEIQRSHRAVGRIEEEDHALRGDDPGPLRRAPNLTAVAGGHLLLVAVVAMPIFLLMPRFSGGALGRGIGQSQYLTGFSDTVRLGDVGELKQNDTVVMHVTLNRDPGRWLRWRGIALEHFDGTRWKNVGRQQPNVQQNRPGESFPIPFNPRLPDGAPPDATQFVEQAIILEGLTADTLFAASRVAAVRGRFGSLRYDSERNLRGPDHSTRRLSYTVTSDISRPTDEALAGDSSTSYPADVVEKDILQLPRIDPRVGELARRLVGSDATPYEKARRLERYLKEEYNYSLTLRRRDASIDPVSDFLLNTRSGHCEYFASGMVVMLRTIGVPARLVNGFQMGEYNSLDGSYRVRQADAHSWVEVYFAGANRWVEFDPTPAAGINEYGSTSFSAQLGQTLDAMRTLWIRYVVGLDEQEQLSLMRTAQGCILEARAWFSAILADLRERGSDAAARVVQSGTLTRERALGALVALTLVGVAAFAAFALHNRGWSLGGFVLPVWRLYGLWGRRRGTQSAAVGFYEQMSAMLARHGLVRQPHETPREFAASAGLEEVRTITEHYHRARFGNSTLEGADREVAEALSRLAARLRRTPKSKI